VKLTPQQIESFHTDGWLFLPELFRAEEVELLAQEAETIYREQRLRCGAEERAPRTAFAAHLYNEAFRLLGPIRRMIDPVEQIFGEKVYMPPVQDQRQIGLHGRRWQWHQDYGNLEARRRHALPKP